MRKIVLKQKKDSKLVKFAIVDDADYEDLKQYKWYYVPNDTIGYGKGYNNGAAITHAGGHVTYMHRYIMNATKNLCVDHINHDTLDNRQSNLRLITPLQNNRNRLKGTKKTSSKFKGVSYDTRTRKWRCSIRYVKPNGERIRYQSNHDTELEAAKYYNMIARKLCKISKTIWVINRTT